MLTKNQAINLAIDNVIKEGLTDIFDRPFELDKLQDPNFRKEVFNEVSSALNDFSLNNFKVQPLEYVVMPKRELYNFRKCALIQPMDTIKYTALVLLMADEIEKRRIGKSKKRVFSYRFSPKKGYLFDSNYNFSSFRSYVQNKVKHKNTKILVECDIANFYDRLNLHRLESILTSIKEITPKVVKLTNELLLFWANRDSYGLPVGGNASRILAEASLIEIDNYLEAKGINFVRFVDDYRFFAKDAITANKWLTILIEKLSQEGFCVNSQKTIIKDVSEKNKEVVAASIEKQSEEPAGIERADAKAAGDSCINLRMGSDYSGIVPRKFREATEKEKAKIIEQVKVEDIFDKVKGSIVVDPDDFKLLIKSIIYQSKYEMFKDIPKLLEKMPQFVPYAIDALIKYESEIAPPIAVSIKTGFSKWLQESEVSEYILISIIRLLGRERYQDLDALFTHFVNLKRNAGSYIGRVLLESMEGKLERGRILEIKGYYQRANLWEKRQITRMMQMTLHYEECRPWLKNIEINSIDTFEKAIFNTKNKDPKKKKPKAKPKPNPKA